MENNVFISFHYKDVYRELFSLLKNRLIRNSINFSVSEHHKISDAADRTIESSQISVVIFSANYAYSVSCLEELVKITDCRERNKQLVIPVFYQVEPSEVRNMTGTYENALKQHEKNQQHSEQLEHWRSALKKTANLSGIPSSKKKNSEILDEIFKNIRKKLEDMNSSLNNSKELVGIDSRVTDVQSLLHQGSGNVHGVGIWGMCGIGKTTIAGEVFQKQKSKFDGFYFLENVREQLKTHGIMVLRNRFFSTLFKKDIKIETQNELPNEIMTKLGDMKVLVVLDDVNDSIQLKSFIGDGDWFRRGSRIIITSRDKQVFPPKFALYEVPILETKDALKLFQMNAFKDNHHLEFEHSKLSNGVVNYANGNPKFLEVSGKILHRKKGISESHQLQKETIKEIYSLMKWSYDILEPKEKCIFLDLACFFCELNLQMGYIELLLKEHKNDNGVAAILDALRDKSFINVSRDNVQMDNVIQAIGWEIGRQESSHSRLIHPDDSYKALENGKGTKATRSIKVNLSTHTKLKLTADVFMKMSELRFIDFHSSNEEDRLDILPKGLEYLPSELRYLRWINYPLKSLPKTFSPERLVILDLSNSKLETLWHGDPDLRNLKQVILRGSKCLKKLPNFSKAVNLELLDICSCNENIIHESVNSLSKLQILR